MTAAPIRIGLLGASKIARGAVMAPVREDPRFVVSAVGARDRDRAAAYAEEHGIPGVAASYAELVARDDVDVVGRRHLAATLLPRGCATFSFNWASRPTVEVSQRRLIIS